MVLDYALSATFIGDFLRDGGCDLGTGGKLLPSYDLTWNDGDVIVGEYAINCTKDGGVGLCTYNIDASRICTDQIDECMVNDVQAKVEMTEEALLSASDPNIAKCAETWGKLFLVSGGFIITAAIVFFVTSGTDCNIYASFVLNFPLKMQKDCKIAPGK